MSFNVLIADDEYFIRQKFKKIIPWTLLDLNFAGEAENGLEVLSILEQTQVDILLLDIKMPKMDGLKAIAEVHARYPSIQVVIISGYNDFEYARTAMRYGVADYLLKPVEPLSLKSVLETCIDKLSALKKRELQLKKYLHYEMCIALSDVQNGSMDIGDFLVRYPDFSSYTHVLYLGAFLFDETGEVLNRLNCLLRTSGFTCEYTKESDYITIFQIFFSEPAQALELNPLLKGFIQTEATYSFLVTGEAYPLTGNWLPHYKRCIHQLSRRYFTADSAVAKEEPDISEQNYSAELAKIRQNISRCLSSRDEAFLNSYTESLFSSVLEEKSTKYLHFMITEIFMTCQLFHQNGEQGYFNIHTFLMNILDEEYVLENLKHTVLSYGLECIRQTDCIPSDISLSRKLTEYVQSHYKNPELSVAQIADVFQLNPSYMGSVFKKVNQLSILQYITQVRMEASKALLDTHAYKISEIAELVGYSDVYYFSKRFKKAYGCSPKDYATRQSISAEEIPEDF